MKFYDMLYRQNCQRCHSTYHTHAGQPEADAMAAACNCKPYWATSTIRLAEQAKQDDPIYAPSVGDAAELFVDCDEDAEEGNHTVYVYDGSAWFRVSVELQIIRDAISADPVPFTLPST